MKAKLLTLIVLFVAVFAVRANDGVFYASGGTLVPLQETRIALRKEVLKFYVVDHGYARVEVDFEFYNPSAARTLTVGFVTPPSDGDFEESKTGHPFITEFTVDINGRTIPYRMKRLAQTSFKKGNINVSGRDWVYYFQATFKKGVNRIRHTYRFRGSVSVEMQREFDYQITTGKRWANRRIDDFELQIHPDNGIYMIIASFQKNGTPAGWKIIGDGTMPAETRGRFSDDGPKIRMFHLNSGYLQFNAKNFKPDNDLFFGEYNWPAGWTSVWCGFGRECAERESLEKVARYFHMNPYDGILDEDFEALSAKEVKFVRNYYFALRGLPFRDPELRRFYERFFWYRPIESLKTTDVRLSKAEDAFLRKVAAFEEKRKN
ncbi:MAG: YARHG domain-containing protein [Acidobacteria bacterium]|nr:YARHG domain-containing protein [Acidobacteriota bacterium]